ncbi:MAG: glycosyl transferase family 17 [Bacteroidetes bacterium]|nr:MAG: glycosyl transferase family 17 [Bacteroidota bacterium]
MGIFSIFKSLNFQISIRINQFENDISARSSMGIFSIFKSLNFQISNIMIYDCFTFFNELDLLEIRLHILDSVADKFVLVEATQTHQGKPKPLYYEENKARFEKFHHKIIHVIVDEYPSNPAGNSWMLEHNQRNGILKGLKDAKPDDVVIISDLDEIPDPQKIRAHKDEAGVKVFRHRMFYYFVNCVNEGEDGSGFAWNGSVLVHRRDIGAAVQPFRENSMKLLAWFHAKPLHRLYWRIRFSIVGPRVKFIHKAGWHFSYLGGVERIIKKLESFAHTEYNKPEYKDPQRIAEILEKGEDLFGRGFKYRFVPLDESFPVWLRENIAKYPGLVKK